MNKKIEEYKKKANRITRTITIIGILVLLLGVLISIIYYGINKSKSLEERQTIYNEDGTLEYSINLEDNQILYEKNFEINLSIKNFNGNEKYKIAILVDDDKVIDDDIVDVNSKFTIELNEEGKKNLNIIIYMNDEEKSNVNLTIYYIEPYKSQFLEKITNKGIQIQYRADNSYEDYEISIPMIKMLGIQNIRADIFRYSIVDNDNVYDFSYYDSWIEDATNAGINIILEFNGFGKKINTDEMIEIFQSFVYEVMKRYPQVKKYEILNEPNYLTDAYKTDEDIAYYSRLVKIAQDIAQEGTDTKSIIAGALAYLSNSTDSKLSTEEFFEKLTAHKGYEYANAYSYHIYDGSNGKNQNPNLINALNKYKEKFNEYGGFIKHYVTEYGVSVYGGKTEETQAYKILQQTVLMDKYGIDYSSIYNFCNSGTDSTIATQTYGLVNNDYTPKPAYYTMKNYYTNTNGSEYIGTLNLQDGLEAHVYNKEGNPIIIAWSDNTDNTYNFTLNEMTAQDLYGKEIALDQNGQIQITTSPVYLYNVSDNYFYQAISNTTTQKYDEFTEKFQDQITKVQGLQATIENLKQRMNDLSTTSSLNETTAINLMKQHYNLGNTIMQAYQSGSLQIEYVTLSSMLDMLDNIGDSFEDLVTVSATTRNTNLSETLTAITNAENLINDDDIEMVYPAKILEFSQDFYDTANYINSLGEENDIKTGLIVSKNLHGQLLANWAQEFAKLYINEYIASNPVEIVYSTTELTNKDVTATLQTNANITVTNNSNRKTYTFYQNGDFTFEYTIKGQAFTKTAVVANIDKTLPKITNVENDKLYTNEVSPQIQDENLQEVKLYKDSNLVQNYQINSIISEDGNYKLVAIDKASNQTEIEFYISRNPASITYSETELTNQNVIASITSNFDVEVTNNANNPQYTFTQNGTFTFQFKIKGTTLNLTATVNNIDKEKPVITGVEQNKQYLEKAIPNVTDDHLKSVELYLNSVKVEGYTPGKELSEEGFYKIVATDQAGNETTVEFMVLEKISEEYKFQDNYVLNIEHSTKREDFEEKLNPYMKYQIIRNGKELTKQDVIATGDKLKTSAGGEYTLIVKGDINKDGEVNVQDIVKLRIYILTKRNLDEEAKLAADCNVDGKEITVKDLVRLRLIVLTKGIV